MSSSNSISDNLLQAPTSASKQILRQQQHQQPPITQNNPVKFIFLKSEDQQVPTKDGTTTHIPVIGFNTRSNTIANINLSSNNSNMNNTNNMNSNAFNSVSFDNERQLKANLDSKWVRAYIEFQKVYY